MRENLASMTSIDLNEFKALYIKTAQEYLQSLTTNLEELAQNPSSVAAIDAMHLATHSLKSQSLVMGYTTTGELSHQLEVFFRHLHDAHEPLPLQKLPEIQMAIAALQSSLESIISHGSEQDLTSQITQFDREVAL
jgi:chemotaxis protein histidine kinase CheA